MCFDAACQATQDRAFVAAVLFPLAASLAAGAWVWNQPSRSVPSSSSPSPPTSSSSSPPDEEGGASGSATTTTTTELFEDPSTGVVFEARPGEKPPERDRRGELAFRAVSFTPFPVEEGCEGERVRVEVGPVASKVPRTYVFEKRLPEPSKVVAVSLARPAGVVFAESKKKRADEKKQVVVDELLEGSPAARRAAAAALNPSLADAAVLPGDLLRGFTTTNFVFRGAGALLGVAAPSREVVVYGADDQGWTAVTAALKRGSASDGDITLIVERREEKL